MTSDGSGVRSASSGDGRVRADVANAEVVIDQGQPGYVELEVTNVSEVIRGYRVAVLGLDPSWTQTEELELELFPGERRATTIAFDLPPTFPAGRQRIAIEVSEPGVVDGSAIVVEVDLLVAKRDEITFGVEPASMTVGAEGTFVVTPVNSGNTTLDLHLTAADPERRTRVEFDPPVPRLLPGERGVVRATVRGPRPWFGMPLVRVLEFRARGGSAEVFTAAAFIQTPRLSRRLVSIAGLVVVATLFAFVIFLSFASVADLSAANEALLKQSLGEDQPVGVRIEPSSVTGRVVSTTGGGIDGVSVELYSQANPLVPSKSTVTDGNGSFRFGALGPGTYFVRYQAAGFGETWFRRGTSVADATPLELVAGQELVDVDVLLGGQPGSIVGTVIGDDVAGALVVAQIPGSSIEGSELAPVAARLSAVEVDATGAFRLDDLPTPAAYEVVVSKDGFAPQIRTISLEPGEVRTDLEILLRRGGGVIAGTVLDLAGTPIPGATVIVSDGQTEVRTRTLSDADVLGTFDVRELPTPGTYSLSVAAPGFFTETQTIVLGEDQRITGRNVRLTASLGSITGRVVDSSGEPLGGIEVTVLGAGVRIVTETVSVPVGFDPSGVPTSQLDASGRFPAQAGTWRISGLHVPGAYTVSFSSPGQQTQAVSVDLVPGAGALRSGIDATLDPSTGTISGRVFESATAIGTGAASVTARAISAEVATLTTAAAHPLQAERLVTVTGVGAPFDGTREITAVTETTFSFAVPGASDLGSQAVAPGGAAATPISGLDGVTVALRSSTLTRTLTPVDQPDARRGTYRFDQVPPGAYTLTVTRPGATTQTILINTANLPRLSDPDRRIVMDRPATLSGTIRPFEGFEGPRRYTVTVFRPDAIGTPVRPPQETGFDGSFAISGLQAPGRYVLQFEDRQTGVRTLIPSPNQRTDVEQQDAVDLEPGVPIDMNELMSGIGAEAFFPFTSFTLTPGTGVPVLADEPPCASGDAGDLYILALDGLIFYCNGDRWISAGLNPEGVGLTPGTFVEVGTITITGPPAKHGPPARLRFGVQPTSRTWDVSLSAARLTPTGTTVVVEIVDANGNVVTTGEAASSVILLTLTTSSGANATLTGTTFVPAKGGRAVFDDLSIPRAQSGYRLVANGGALPVVSSNTFAVNAIVPGASTLVQLDAPREGRGWTVSWAAPFSDGGSNIAYYLVEAVGATGSGTTPTLCVGSATVSGLTIPAEITSRPVYLRSFPAPLTCELPSEPPFASGSTGIRFRVHAVNGAALRSVSTTTPTSIVNTDGLITTTSSGSYRVLGNGTTSTTAFVERGRWFNVSQAVTIDQLIGGGAVGSDWTLRLRSASSPSGSGTILRSATVAGTTCGAERPAGSITSVVLEPGVWYAVTSERLNGGAYHCEASGGVFQLGSTTVGSSTQRFGSTPDVPVGFRVAP